MKNENYTEKWFTTKVLAVFNAKVCRMSIGLTVRLEGLWLPAFWLQFYKAMFIQPRMSKSSLKPIIKVTRSIKLTPNTDYWDSEDDS